MIFDCSYGDEWEIQYFEMKYGKWVLKGGDLNSRKPNDMLMVEAKIDGRGRYTFSIELYLLLVMVDTNKEIITFN